MKTIQFEKLIQAVTGRPLKIQTSLEEILLDSKIYIHRPWQGGKTILSFEWKTPKKEDSLLRSFITTFCSKYKEPDPETYSRNCPCYGDTWTKYEEPWNNPDTHWTCAPWHHHRDHQTSKEVLKTQIIANFANFDAGIARLGFYETNYGIGIFTIYGGAWVEKSLEDMKRHLNSHAVPYRNELSDAGWVTRFLIGIDKSAHSNILGSF